jgi:hypothetical protein
MAVEINERTTKKQAKSLPGNERGRIGHRERRGRKVRALTSW